MTDDTLQPGEVRTSRITTIEKFGFSGGVLDVIAESLTGADVPCPFKNGEASIEVNDTGRELDVIYVVRERG